MRRNGKILIVVILAALTAVIACFVWPKGKEPASHERIVAEPAATPEPTTMAAFSGRTTQPAGGPATNPAVNAPAAYRKGMELLAAGKLVEARTQLSDAFFSGQLPPELLPKAIVAMTDLAERTILSRQIAEGDPYTMEYTFKSGDVPQKVERDLKLHVPVQLLLRVNGIEKPEAIRAGATMKLIQGPFHAIVSKGGYTMDLHLQREEMPKVFVKRVRVGLGKDGRTPLGHWRVALGKKLEKMPWNPPPNAAVHKTILWGESGYPLGKDGYWISLEGTDDNTRNEDGYGIHGTNEPDSIGKDASLGCIRLADVDIALVYSLLYEKWSTVEIVP